MKLLKQSYNHVEDRAVSLVYDELCISVSVLGVVSSRFALVKLTSVSFTASCYPCDAKSFPFYVVESTILKNFVIF